MHAADDIRIEEVPRPVAGPGELLLQVETVGICGTDASEFAHPSKFFPIEHRHPVTGHVGPFIPGHEFSGRVVSFGPGVEGFSEDDLVASAGSAGCGECAFCSSGRPSRCDGYWAVGLQSNGALAEYCTVPAGSCIEVGALGLTPDAAALAQPMAIAVHALRRGRIRGGEDVVVIGAGGIGVFVSFAAAAAGCHVLAVDLSQERLDIASSVGAGSTVLAGSGPTGVAEVVFEITGTETGLEMALAALGPGGRLVAVGFQKQPLTVDAAALTAAELEWIGTNGIDAAADLPQAVRLLAAREGSWSDVAPLVHPLSETSALLGSLASGQTKAVKTLISPSVDEVRASHM
jgi:(R,R)-butanediol dehydrogenase/meso-butanediol dehydrogenase/diacetyl reductase